MDNVDQKYDLSGIRDALYNKPISVPGIGEIRFAATCKCGNPIIISAVGLSNTTGFRDYAISLVINQCKNCLRLHEEASSKEGYKKGYEKGYEVGFESGSGIER